MGSCAKVQFNEFRGSAPRFTLKRLWVTRRLAR